MIINLRSVLSTIVGAEAKPVGTGVSLIKNGFVCWSDLKGVDRDALASTLRQIADAVAGAAAAPVQEPPAPAPRDDSQYEFDLADCKPDDIFLGTSPAPEPTHFKSKRGKR